MESILYQNGDSILKISLSMIICYKCNRSLPEDEFYVRKTTTNGRYSYCRSCNKIACHQRFKQRSAREHIVYPDSKTCGHCHIVKPFDQFSKDRSARDGLHRLCLSCDRDIKRQRVESQPVRGKMRSMLSDAKRRAKKNQIPFSLTLDWLMEQFGNVTHCPATGIELRWLNQGTCDDSPSLDKVIPELGYVPGNVEMVSRLANAMKRNATPEQLSIFCRYYSNHSIL